MHATIERAARYEKIFEPNDLVPIIQNAKRRGKKYDVELVGAEILDCHPLADTLQSWVKKNAKWKQVREIKIDPEHPGKVFLRHDLSAPTMKEIKITKVGRQVNLSTYSFPKAFIGPLQLKACKLKDLATLCNELVIPSHKHEFYKGLLNFPELNNPLLLEGSEDEESESEDEEMTQAQREFLFDFNNDEENNEIDTDYEEELEIARALNARQDGQPEIDGEDVEDVDDPQENNSEAHSQSNSYSASLIYDEDGLTDKD